MIGTTIGNYEVKSLLGEGGMGNVYLALHTQLGRKVAIKSLHQQLVKNEGLRARFKQEANTMAHLQHNGIVTLFDYVEDERGLFLIMEFVEGTQLDEYIRNISGPIPAERAVPILNDILDAFAYAHEKGVVHRDIKPSNILITNDGKVKILDFGIAKMLSDSGNKLTKTGTQMGTVFYMSPEQVQGKEVDIRSDIYSLGITFYQMLTGVSPYDGMTTEFEVYSKIVAEPLPSANATYPGVPAALDLIIAKATAKMKEDRFQTCREFSSFLKNPSEQIPNSISQTTIVENKQLNENIEGGNRKTEISQPSKSSSPLKVVLITLGALFASLIILIFIFSNSENDSRNAYYAADSAAAADVAAADAAAADEATRVADSVAVADAAALAYANSISPNATIDRIWVDHNQYELGELGMMIHLSFTVNNLQNEQGSISCYFYDSNRDKIFGQPGYTASDGHIAFSKSFFLTYTSTQFEDFYLFMPYSELEIGYNCNLNVQAQLIVNGVSYSTSEYVEFTYNPNN